jgi:hypothetical protein
MSDGHHADDPLRVGDLVEDTVIADADTVGVASAAQLL